VSVVIPPGSVSADTQVNIVVPYSSEAVTIANAKLLKWHFAKDSTELAGTVCGITLASASLNAGKKVRLTLHYPATIDIKKEGFLKMFWLNEANNTWEMVKNTQTMDTTNKLISVEVEHFSVYRILEYSTLAVDLNTVVAFPNPVNFASAIDKRIKFYNLTRTSGVYIYTVSGDLVISLESNTTKGNSINDSTNGIAFWDGKNESGESVVSGLYFYLIKDKLGKTAKGKILILK
jgi:hypothetical protein